MAHDADDKALAVFEEYRSALFGVAYRMLGRVTDAEDIVQEAWLRWSGAHRDGVRDPRAYLVRVVTRLAIDRLRQHAARRETYVGPWLPEPLPTDRALAGLGATPDGADRAVLADTVSYAVLLVMETLSPLERAVFVLREAFGLPYSEIAAALGRDQPAVRQLAGRARRHMSERRPRFTVDAGERRDLTERFLAAALEGDMDGLMSLLAADVSLVGDSGGRAKAPLRVIEGADKVSRFGLGIAKQAPPAADYHFMDFNGAPTLLVFSHGRPHSVFMLGVADGLVRRVYLVTNPEKLAHLAPPV
ncbi:RNA polymerase sigma factor SigJ [Streptomyces litchfieldiae]|uniref:RNA polymerase sigma factor SigJ n=1 Tax=Streptomyces litchfieldiae TaxID=3075543 RepID=A0ABU2N0H0_9ACTN|nr:RNA polymerase sigma factor SigJ [Streptomyces sp. DSM 44938]MDT0347389.1 RNA polymerase sigma factor SigJ [Streptomyces sp. DSM 44938]